MMNSKPRNSRRDEICYLENATLVQGYVNNNALRWRPPDLRIFSRDFYVFIASQLRTQVSNSTL